MVNTMQKVSVLMPGRVRSASPNAAVKLTSRISPVPNVLLKMELT